jgi:hypothetical protein
METLRSIWINSIRCDNVSLIVFGKPDRDPPPPWWRDPPLREISPDFMAQVLFCDRLAV